METFKEFFNGKLNAIQQAIAILKNVHNFPVDPETRTRLQNAAQILQKARVGPKDILLGLQTENPDEQRHFFSKALQDLLRMESY